MFVQVFSTQAGTSLQRADSARAVRRSHADPAGRFGLADLNHLAYCQQWFSRPETYNEHPEPRRPRRSGLSERHQVTSSSLASRLIGNGCAAQLHWNRRRFFTTAGAERDRTYDHGQNKYVFHVFLLCAISSRRSLTRVIAKSYLAHSDVVRFVKARCRSDTPNIGSLPPGACNEHGAAFHPSGRSVPDTDRLLHPFLPRG
jgi:hypothetical protein